jgi:glycosyltransferase involved in cell wall biosynthesis
MDLVSIIIPTFNRYHYLLNTIKSIKEQTYKNIEIIVVNDCSTEKEYYNHDWKNDEITMIHLKENTKKQFGFACAGFVRNKGIEVSTSKYIAFCDDDDIWLSNKLELQIEAMKRTSCKICATDGLIGKGIYNPKLKYLRYNAQYYYNVLQNIFNHKGSNLLNNGFPEIWTLDFLRIHNCVICSSIIIKKEILDAIGNFKNVKNGQEDYDCWLSALQYTNCVYVSNPCFYYDNGHGDGQLY